MWFIIEQILSLKDNAFGSTVFYLMALVSRLRIFGPKRRVLKLKQDPNQTNYDDNSDFRRYFDIRNSSSSSSLIETNISCNVIDYLHRREHGTSLVRPVTFDANYGTRYLLEQGLFRESEVSVQSYNKIFCSKWLSDRHILFGTKCNKLVVLDLLTKEFIRIPSLESSRHSRPPDVPCGIHSIQINPSRTLLVTGASNSNDVAVYRLPTLDPVCVGEGAHRDWIFDAVWLDDQFFITGSRDTTVALWQVRDSGTTNVDAPNHSIMSPLLVRKCEKAQKVRALSFNHKYQEFVALSLDACLHIWDINCFKQKFSRKLPQCSENVCLAMREDCSMYAVGSKSYLTLHDSRSLCAVDKVPTKTPSCSIRSASFNDNLVTLGTGMGVIMFYDCRARKYLEKKPDPSLETSNSFRMQSNLPYVETYRPPVMLQANRGWVCPDDVFHEVFQGIDYSPAIYTHCYDPSGTKLFTAGGPLPANLYGSYAGLWQ